MSETQKQQRPNATPIKNPLLSASVTGLTFDDFPNKPLLLPAAPPIVHAPIPAPVVTPTGLVTRGKSYLSTPSYLFMYIMCTDAYKLSKIEKTRKFLLLLLQFRFYTTC